MLQYSAVEPRTLDVLKGLMQIRELNNFYLAGGTALALYFGHRRSVDIDLFSATEFSNESLIAPLEKNFQDLHTGIHIIQSVCLDLLTVSKLIL